MCCDACQQINFLSLKPVLQSLCLKTKYSIIGSHNKLTNLNHQFDVKIDEHSLEGTKTYKYLGIDLDESLSWDSQILTNMSGTWCPVRLLL